MATHVRQYMDGRSWSYFSCGMCHLKAIRTIQQSPLFLLSFRSLFLYLRRGGAHTLYVVPMLAEAVYASKGLLNTLRIDLVLLHLLLLCLRLFFMND
jgi:hypothetical protein